MSANHNNAERITGDLAIWQVICPTCHSVNRAPAQKSLTNAWRIAWNTIVGIALGIIPLRLRRRCQLYGASFYAKSRVSETFCWTCGYPLKGLPTPRCPECGTDCGIKATHQSRERKLHGPDNEPSRISP